MGCDIHSVIQGQHLHTDHKGNTILNPDDSCWHSVGEGFHMRQYALFGLLSGVRSAEHSPMVEPRGLPDNFKITEDGDHYIPINFRFRSLFRGPTNAYSPHVYWMGDHSYTWLRMEELVDIARSAAGREFQELEAVAEEMRVWSTLYRDYRNWRIVIGFDS